MSRQLLQKQRTVSVPASAVPRTAQAAALACAQPHGLSLCMIVRDEARSLPDFFRQHRPLVDELVVVDTGSRDATRQIAVEHGARLFEFAWCDDFSAARNESLRRARYSWALVLDADECIAAEEFGHVRTLLELERFKAVYFAIENVDPTGAWLGRHFAIRMFRNTPETRFRGAIHEQVMTSGESLCTDLRILHSGYRLNPEHMRAKLERDKTLLQTAVAEQPQNTEYHYYLARTHYLLGEHEAGLLHARQARAALEDTGDEGSLYFLTAHLEAALWLRCGEPATAEQCCRCILVRRDDYLDVIFLLAKICLQRRRLREARRSLQRYLELRPHFAADVTAGFPFGMLTTLQRGAEAHNELASLYHQSGDSGKAIIELERAARLEPSYAPTYCNWGIALLRQGKAAEAVEKFRQALHYEPTLSVARQHLAQLEQRLHSQPARSAQRRNQPRITTPSLRDTQPCPSTAASAA